MLLRNFYVAQGWDHSPGSIYAAMLASGESRGNNLGPISASEGVGAFKVRPRRCGQWTVGSYTVAAGQDVAFQFTVVNAPTPEISMAIYWPETDTTYHNKIGLTLSKTIGTTTTNNHAQNASNPWQRIVLGQPATGTWTAHIRGLNVARGPQKVYAL